MFYSLILCGSPYSCLLCYNHFWDYNLSKKCLWINTCPLMIIQVVHKCFFFFKKSFCYKYHRNYIAQLYRAGDKALKHR